MRLSIDEYCKRFKMSKEMVNSKIRAKKLNYIIEGGLYYIVVPDTTHSENKKIDTIEPDTLKPKNVTIDRPKTTVATVLSLYQRENKFLKDKILQLEAKVDKLIDDKEQMLRDERDKIEQIYSTKDEQLKNVLELINKKLKLEKEEAELQKIENYHYQNEAEVIDTAEIVELKEYLKSLDLKPYQKKAIKKRFLDIYDSDIRIIQKNQKLYLNFSKYDYSDLLGY